MASEQIDKAIALMRGMAGGDVALATRHVDPERYVDHDARVAGDAAGLRAFVEAVSETGADLHIVRTLEDGAFVMVQARSDMDVGRDLFEVFRFAGAGSPSAGRSSPRRHCPTGAGTPSSTGRRSRSTSRTRRRTRLLPALTTRRSTWADAATRRGAGSRAT